MYVIGGDRLKFGSRRSSDEVRKNREIEIRGSPKDKAFQILLCKFSESVLLNQ